jgi:hypothetical protein
MLLICVSCNVIIDINSLSLSLFPDLTVLYSSEIMYLTTWMHFFASN